MVPIQHFLPRDLAIQCTQTPDLPDTAFQTALIADESRSWE
jgi:hypothetical protein